MKVLVCGGRGFSDESAIVNHLFGLDDEDPITAIIHGGASGADTIAGHTAELLKVPCTVYRAAWKKHGKAAGPIRNQRMLDEGKPDLVVAYAGGRGTADMVRRAKAAGVKVIEVP